MRKLFVFVGFILCSCSACVNSQYDYIDELSKENVCGVTDFEPTQRDFENLMCIYDYIVEENNFDIPDSLLRDADENPSFWTYYYVIEYCMKLPEFGDTVGETDMWYDFCEKFYDMYFAY